jgi:3-isopropylmalate/(R)-2-methylmalate dehydratase large subunit
MVARPWSPSDVVPIDDVAGTSVTVAFLGSCASGRLEDLRAAAEVCRGRSVHPGVRFVVIPASATVLKEALARGYIQTLLECGAVLEHTSCGPCGGIDKGVLAADDVCVSTSTRNYRGRMGHPDSRTYLASARTVAHAAIAGEITCH